MDSIDRKHTFPLSENRSIVVLALNDRFHVGLRLEATDLWFNIASFPKQRDADELAAALAGTIANHVLAKTGATAGY